MRMPLQEVARCGEGDDETGAHVVSNRAADEFGGRLCAGPGEFDQQLKAATRTAASACIHGS